MRFVIHIGWEKTGTTSIQQYLHARSKYLAGKGVFYLSSPGRIEHAYLSHACLNLEKHSHLHKLKGLDSEEDRRLFRDDVFGDFRQKMSDLPPKYHTVLISSEHFSTVLDTSSEVIRLRKVLSEFSEDIEIIAYIRDQEDQIVSAYSTRLKSGAVLKFSEHLDSNLKYARFNYAEALALWGDVFGDSKVNVGVYSNTPNSGHSLIDDFLSRVSNSLRVANGHTVRRKNKSLSKFGCQLLRRVNLLTPTAYRLKAPMNAQRKLLVRLLLRMPGQGLRMTEAQRERVRETYLESNKQVLAKWFPKQSKLFY